MTGTMTHKILLTRFQEILLTRDGVPKNPYRGRHGPAEEGRITPTWPPFLRPGSLHSPTFTECYAIQAFSIASDFDSKLIPKIQNQITMRKFASSYNPLFRVVQITIRDTARITRNTTRFSPWNGGRTLSTT